MRDASLLGPWVRRFLMEHLVSERNLARNTQRSYRDTLRLLLPDVAQHISKPIERLAVTDLSADRFVLNASSPGTLVVRVRASTHWALRGEGCVEATDDGWTQVRVDVPGVVEVVQALRGTPCAG